MMMGVHSRASRSPIVSAPTVVVVEIAMIAAAAPAAVEVAAVIVVIGVAPTRSWIDGLHRDLGSWLSCGVEGLSSGVILCPELHCGLHGDFGLLGKAMTAVGGRGAAVSWGRGAI